MIFKLSGDILHPGFVLAEGLTLEVAIKNAENGEFLIADEQSECLSFKFDGTAWDKDGNEI